MSIPGHLGWVPYFRELTVPSVDDGTVAFQAKGFLDFTGILTWDSTGLSIGADHATAMPGMDSTKFLGFGSLTTVADTSAMRPGLTATFAQFVGTQLEGTQFAFGAGSRAGKRTGIYTTSLGINTIVDTGTPFPALSLSTLDSFSCKGA